MLCFHSTSQDVIQSSLLAMFLTTEILQNVDIFKSGFQHSQDSPRMMKSIKTLMFIPYGDRNPLFKDLLKGFQANLTFVCLLL